jgi:hypothetical protein
MKKARVVEPHLAGGSQAQLPRAFHPLYFSYRIIIKAN